MKFSINCPHCNVRLNVDSKVSGTQVNCPGCKAPFTCPTPPFHKVTNIYCKIKGNVIGPMGLTDLQIMVLADEVNPDDLVKQGEDGEWFSASMLTELEGVFPEPSGQKHAATPPPTETATDTHREATKADELDEIYAAMTSKEKPKLSRMPKEVQLLVDYLKSGDERGVLRDFEGDSDWYRTKEEKDLARDPHLKKLEALCKVGAEALPEVLFLCSLLRNRHFNVEWRAAEALCKIVEEVGNEAAETIPFLLHAIEFGRDSQVWAFRAYIAVEADPNKKEQLVVRSMNDHRRGGLSDEATRYYQRHATKVRVLFDMLTNDELKRRKRAARELIALGPDARWGHPDLAEAVYKLAEDSKGMNEALLSKLFSVFGYSQHDLYENAERQLWAKAVSEDTPEAYRTYLRETKLGKFESEAKAYLGQ
ncbi:MAG: DUF4339 domain-containing protein [Planctomycetes bacterium]|nr:DUF4339 domain-containing protein [Planctomycetota bacterium]